MSRYQYNEAATVPAINAELEKIQEAIEDSLSRSGDTPNTMTAPLDMNGERIMNLPAAVSDSEPMRKGEAQPFVDAAAASATAALQSEQAAAASASSASASASSSSADAAVAEELIEELNSLYLGAFNSNPSTDNEGNALVKGVLYYNNVLNEIYVFNGISWVIAASQQTATDAASSAFQAANSAAAALASQNAASTSASQASASATSASTSSTQASGFAASASDSATAAQTSATNASGSATDAATSAAAALSSESVVSASADAAALSETNAAGSATAAATSATSASNSASAASTSASNAAGSATAAATSETNAASSATSAASSATSASTSATTALQYLEETETARDEVLQYSTAVSKGLVFIGLYDASTGVYPTLPVDIVGNPFWIISTGGTVSGVVLNPGDSLIYDVTNEVFIKLDTVDQVVSVAGKTGAVSLDKADVGLANVDNTSDLNKPISTATQTALDGKANTSHTHVISDVTGLQSALDAKVDDSQLATAATADSVAQRTSDGSLNAVDVNATRLLTTGNVGIGTSTPDTRLMTNGGTVKFKHDQAAVSQVVLDNQAYNTTAAGYAILATDSTFSAAMGKISFGREGAYNETAGSRNSYIGLSTVSAGTETERLRIDSSGNVGIGTSSPGAVLESVAGITAGIFTSTSTNLHTGDAVVRIRNIGDNDVNTNSHRLLDLDYAGDDSVVAGEYIRFLTGGTQRAELGLRNDQFTISQNGTERMRINSSGDLFVAKTERNGSTFGFEARSDGTAMVVTGLSAPAAYLNRQTNDGDIVQFAKGNVLVGSITVENNGINIGSGSVGLRFSSPESAVMPFNISSNAVTDNTIDLGTINYRYDDIYATNGTIQTSDKNDKQDIEELSEAEHRVAVACKSLLRKFRWKSSVEEKGDDARIHFGIIAQDLQAAFEAEGLDAGRYAMFIHTDWWEHEVEVPAVEAQDAVYETVTDEDGNETEVLVSEAVEAVDAYTRTDTYYTEEEAPEGAVKKSRMGVRYSELLAFIIAGI